MLVLATVLWGLMEFSEDPAKWCLCPRGVSATGFDELGSTHAAAMST
jgi:hypothetical protein